MANDMDDHFVPIKDAEGRVTGTMDRALAEHLASAKPLPSQSSVTALLRSVTRVRIVPLENYRVGATELRTLLDTSDPADLASFRACFTIIEDPKSFGHCMCFGEPHLELYAGEQRVATFGYHHGFAIRWDAWLYDAYLAEPQRLLDWMSERGVDGPQREVDEMRRQHEEHQRHAERWAAATPACFRSFSSEQMNKTYNQALHAQLRAALQAAYAEPTAQILTLFGWFGSGAGPWSGYPSCEGMPEQLLVGYATPQLIASLEMTEPNEAQWRGAARYFAGWNFKNKKPDGRALLTVELRQRLLEAATSTGIADNIDRATASFGV